MNTPLKTDTEAVIFGLLETASALERRFDRALMFRGTSFSEYRLLKTLAETDADGMPRIALAAAVGLTASAVTRALKPLEKLGYVATRRNERDARQSLAQITDGGRQLLQEGGAALADVMAGLRVNSLNRADLAAFQSRLADFQ